VSLERCLLRCSQLKAGVWLRTVGPYTEYLHIDVAQPVSCSTTFMSRSIMRSTIFGHCVALGGVRLGVSSLWRSCCPLWSAWIPLGFLSGTCERSEYVRILTYTYHRTSINMDIRDLNHPYCRKSSQKQHGNFNRTTKSRQSPNGYAKTLH
jgi:hypothetical protein